MIKRFFRKLLDVLFVIFYCLSIFVTFVLWCFGWVFETIGKALMFPSKKLNRMFNIF